MAKTFKGNKDSNQSSPPATFDHTIYYSPLNRMAVEGARKYKDEGDAQTPDLTLRQRHAAELAEHAASLKRKAIKARDKQDVERSRILEAAAKSCSNIVTGLSETQTPYRDLVRAHEVVLYKHKPTVSLIVGHLDQVDEAQSKEKQKKTSSAEILREKQISELDKRIQRLEKTAETLNARVSSLREAGGPKDIIKVEKLLAQADDKKAKAEILSALKAGLENGQDYQILCRDLAHKITALNASPFSTTVRLINRHLKQLAPKISLSDKMRDLKQRIFGETEEQWKSIKAKAEAEETERRSSQTKTK